MARKKTSDQQEAVSDQPSANSDQITVDIQVEADKLLARDQYVTGTWAGQPHYECNACEYDTLDELEMLNHLVNKHNSEQALEILVALEPTPPPATPQMATNAQSGEGSSNQEVYEIQLKEDDSNG